jgi:hypothetical protein
MLQMTEEQADRNLLELADLLEQVQARHGHFDMQRWVRISVGEQPACCTPSCAAGWWTHHRYGLEQWPQDSNARSNARYFSNIIQRDFGIGPETAAFARLFGAHPHRTAVDEAQVIRAFVHERQSIRSAAEVAL